MPTEGLCKAKRPTFRRNRRWLSDAQAQCRSLLQLEYERSFQNKTEVGSLCRHCFSDQEAHPNPGIPPNCQNGELQQHPKEE